MALSPMAESIAKKMLEESDREVNRLRLIIKELTIENNALKMQSSDKLKEELNRAKETIAMLMNKLEKK